MFFYVGKIGMIKEFGPLQSKDLQLLNAPHSSTKEYLSEKNKINSVYKLVIA
ncbi:hypothetical protein I588_05067 [Enterococcus pallens ATCC BAA-351]|uniref:Uncharacterized protein n=1 Tax=Enterococcus pallens ATCC BAA-351 TaxID=1158607 RepID=R2ST12_9ENTE|nr:hypothetical protein UAU_03773 [Enterococcus pallens ATCC BAA-351]EOU11398.1 hypothetical protein I588_05067 [Enterococcus pallens ATCC BAA-351]